MPVWREITELRASAIKKEVKIEQKDSGYYRYTSNPDRFSFNLMKSDFKLGSNVADTHVRIFFKTEASGNLRVKIMPGSKAGDTRTTGLFKVKEYHDRYRIMGGLPSVLPSTKGVRFPISKVSNKLGEVLFSIKLEGVE